MGLWRVSRIFPGREVHCFVHTRVTLGVGLSVAMEGRPEGMGGKDPISSRVCPGAGQPPSCVTVTYVVKFTWRQVRL